MEERMSRPRKQQRVGEDDARAGGGRGAGEKQGIGAHVPEREMESCIGRNARQAASLVNDLGFAVFPSVVPRSVCDGIREKIDLARSRACTDDFTRIHNRKYRKDLPLALHSFAPEIKEMLKHEVLCDVLEKIVGASSSLVEFAAMTILPGAAAQPVHQDVHQASPAHADSARYLTVFVSLSDVSNEMGPMELFAGTQRMYIPWPEDDQDDRDECGEKPGALSDDEDVDEEMSHSVSDSSRLYVQGATSGEVGSGGELAALTIKHLGQATARVSLTVSKGDVYVVDPRVLHRGKANLAKVPKQTLYFSVEEREDGKLKLLGSTDSLLPRYKGKFTLRDLCQKEEEEEEG